jgi:hypothetical protein
MNIAIVGSRGFSDYYLLETTILEHLCSAKKWPIKLISGGAKGADTLAEQLAENFNLEIQIFLPDWDKHGKAAGFIRNTQIVEACDFLFAFWDGESRGTKHSIDIARKLKKPTLIIYF